jgi:predicted O-methyltransferase YrrM
VTFLFPADVDGWLSPAEGQALYELARRSGDDLASVLELGSYAGRSAICLAQGAGRVWCVDTFDGRATPDQRPTLEAFLGNVERYGVRGRVVPIVSRTEDAGGLLEGPFDLVFVDADHSEAACARDIAFARRVLAAGGTVAVHDYRRPGNEGVTAAVDGSGLYVARLVDTLAVCRVPPG